MPSRVYWLANWRRLAWLFLVVGALALFGPDAAPPPAPDSAQAGTLPTGFQETTVFSGLTNPTAIRFASDGRVFVAEKSGLIKVFDSLTDTTPTVFADLRTNVDDYWDRGMLGLALDPNFPIAPYVYVLYSYDHELGSTNAPPRWGDACPTPPGPTTDGCVISARVSRLQAAGNQMTGSEQVLVEDWCQQYPSHSIGTLQFGPDGALYAGAGDGASFVFADYGQDGSPLNPCGDPPGGPGSVLVPPTAEGGALRAQDLQTSGDPVSLDGSVIRINPSTGAGMPDNPLAGSSDPNARRIIAEGLRNPFRFAFRPGTSEVWIGDVGWNDWEEINRLVNPTDGSVDNFGWPCYEGNARQPAFDAANLNICENLYNNPNADTKPFFSYHHTQNIVPGETCPTGSSSVTGIAFDFAPTGTSTFPPQYQGALFFADHSRNCIWAMKKNGNPIPSPGSIDVFDAGASNPVDLEFGPGGDLYYVDFDGGTIRRIRYDNSSGAPTVTSKTPAAGATGVALNVHPSATFSESMDPSTLTTSTFTLVKQGTSTPLAATVTYDDPSHTATLTPGASLLASTTYTATVKGGASGAKDLAGNPLAADVSWSFTTGTQQPSTIYLSDIDWVSMANGSGPVEKDRSVGTYVDGDGNPITLNGTVYPKGLGAHAVSDVRYLLNGCNRFKASIGVDDEVGDNGSVVFQVYADSTKVYESPILTGSSATVNVDVDVSGATQLGLLVQNGGDNLDYDHADWASARIECGGGAGDTTPPTLDSKTPAAGATGVALNVHPSATFSESMDPSTLTTSTFTLVKQGTSTPLAATVTYDDPSHTATLTPGASLLASTTYTATVKGGASGAKDLAGNPLAADVSWSFTTGTQQPSTIYLSDIDWVSMANGSGPVEKDRSVGTYVDGDGNPITLNGTVYPKGLGGHAVSDVRYLLNGCNRFKASIGVDDEVGDNGSVVFQVYADSTKVYESPILTGSSATVNVDVDVSGATQLGLLVQNGGDNLDYDHADWASARIECGGGAGDTTPPTLDSKTPAAGATGVALNVHPSATFSESMDPSTLTTSTFTLVKQGTSTPLAATVTYDDPSHTATLTPGASLLASTTYTATVKGGASGAKDLAGNPLAADVSWSFTTGAGANQPPVPVIDTPSSTLHWKVGDLISFSGHATDPQDGTLPASALSWTLVLQHCPSNCHTHNIQTWTGVSSGSFNAPDHDYPSYLELQLTATDSAGASASTTLRLDPQTVVLTFNSSPTGLQLVVGSTTSTTSFTRTVIVGSSNSISATSPQTLGSTTYQFSSWSDGGAQTHNITAPATATTYTANFIAVSAPVNAALPVISGQSKVGRTLTTSDGSWTGSQPITFAYQWLRCTTNGLSTCTNIVGANSKSYVVAGADGGFRMRVRVTASNVIGSTPATSNATPPMK